MPIDAQLGVIKDVTYGVSQVVTRFFEFDDCQIVPEVGRVQGRGLRAGQLVTRKDRRVPYVTGYAGSVTLDVLTKGYGFWLEQMVGVTATSAQVDSAYTHTGTLAATLPSFNLQTNNEFVTGGNQAMTYCGGKVTKWELSCDVEGQLKCMLDLVFASGATGTALATASYPSSAELLTWAGAGLVIGTVTYNPKSWKISCDNMTKNDRYALRSNTARREPLVNAYRNISWEATVDHEDLTLYNKVISTDYSSLHASLVATTTGPTLIGTATYPSLAVTVDEASFDEGAPVIAGEALTEVTYQGTGSYDGTNPPLVLTYVTADATP